VVATPIRCTGPSRMPVPRGACCWTAGCCARPEGPRHPGRSARQEQPAVVGAVRRGRPGIRSCATTIRLRGTGGRACEAARNLRAAIVGVGLASIREMHVATAARRGRAVGERQPRRVVGEEALRGEQTHLVASALAALDRDGMKAPGRKRRPGCLGGLRFRLAAPRNGCHMSFPGLSRTVADAGRQIAHGGAARLFGGQHRRHRGSAGRAGR